VWHFPRQCHVAAVRRNPQITHRALGQCTLCSIRKVLLDHVTMTGGTEVCQEAGAEQSCEHGQDCFHRSPLPQGGCRGAQRTSADSRHPHVPLMISDQAGSQLPVLEESVFAYSIFTCLRLAPESLLRRPDY